MLIPDDNRIQQGFLPGNSWTLVHICVSSKEDRKMLVRSSGGNGAAAAMMVVMRHFASSSRKRAPNLRKINPRVPFQEAACIAEDLYGVIKTNGPLTISNTWNHIKEGGISGLSSKTHMKLMLKWMRGRSMLKQICNGTGTSKKFLLSTLPEDPNQPNNYVEEPKLKSERPSKLNKKQLQKKQSR